MIEARVGDITTLIDVDAITNAANGVGVMGAGVAGAIRRTAGKGVEEEAKKICDQYYKKEGCCYSTSSGELSNNGIRKIYHAVTMRYPGGFSTLHDVGSAMSAVVHEAIKDGMRSIAFTGLGTGIGSLDTESVATIMFNVALKHSDIIDIFFVDGSEFFIAKIQKLIEQSEGSTF